ncbi:hypothetical protein [Methylobacterium trifolii]|uniref:Transcriptional regulator n=1 Tax=Methylobacterium trifolii TaxID=1003092 RepID=A0ABQ4U3H3_9HYPH|nr:hypothetical protein [Methylobacterium trifolii]GJE61311.1 hypothetical protein MPOCJGCO_3432 [Methylobacterium trifolii]
MSADRLELAQKSGRSKKDLQLLVDQAARLQDDQDDAASHLEEKILRLKALRLSRDAAPKPGKAR